MKQKTNKSVSKKFRVTGSGKVTRRSTGHNHYNVRDTGVATRNKRSDAGIAVRADEKNLLRVMPYV
ncbi:MAG: 50S ribosomal protein L35 [Candidatus Moranbacteria bacterium]|jgi:large subunit ribosomal protein L35|nr:50S ribosomal protein L35 [Candidatus Moranbacteria bacterium]MBP9801090.1 50S ribosomal protein L35 [Candidatus Moranbacteria bacterium]